MLSVIILSIVMLSVIKAERCYAECNFTLIVGNFIGLLSVIMLSVVMLSVIAPSASLQQ